MPATFFAKRIVTCSVALALCASVLAFGVLTTWAKPVRPHLHSVAPHWALWSAALQRNMVNLHEKNLPAEWSVEEGKTKNVKWSAEVRAAFLGQPVVAHGKVFVGATNLKPRDPKIEGNRAVLLAFRETDGAFEWQITHEYPAALPVDVHTAGLISTPAVDERRLYYVTPACEVVCADVGDGGIHWRYDMMKQLAVSPYYCSICSPLVAGEFVYVVTGNGRDDLGRLLAPEAPSFVAFHKKTGKVAWQSNLPGRRIIEGSWSSPTLAVVNDVPQIIMAGGDCVLYSFEPDTGKLLWKCDCIPVRKKAGERGIDLYIVAAPVVVGNRLYVGLGVHVEHPNRPPWSWFLCLDIAKKGDVSLKSYDANDAKNKDSALIWAFGGPIDPPQPRVRRAYFGPTISTASVHDGLVFVTELHGYLHCLDAKTGHRYWVHDFKTDITGSTYWVDSKIYVGTQDGEVCIFAPDKTGQLLATIDMEDALNSTPTAANGTLYFLTKNKLFAISAR